MFDLSARFQNIEALYGNISFLICNKLHEIKLSVKKKSYGTILSKKIIWWKTDKDDIISLLITSRSGELINQLGDKSFAMFMHEEFTSQTFFSYLRTLPYVYEI